nr:ribonuclease H-like domain-containing protein [Tanacetum cinerariifolium]
PPPPATDTNPYNVFRPREKTHRLHTRRIERRENNVQSFEKLHQVRRNLEQAKNLLEAVIRKVIVNGDSVSLVAPTSSEGPIPPKTAEQKLARKNELKAKSTLMLAIPDEHLLKFHACKDAKSLWESIKNRFGGNKESKKMQKPILKQNYKNFAASSQERLDKTYDRFRKIISQLEIHGEVISQEDANLKLLRSLTSAWNYIALIMRNKSDLDTLSMDDLYNNLNLNNEDLERIDTDDLEEIDLKWKVAMLTMRVKRFIQKTKRKLDLNGKETVVFDRTKVECYNYHRRCYFARECWAPRNQGNKNRDAPTRNEPVDTSTTNALYDQQREALNKSNLEIIGYQIRLESLEAMIVVYEKNEVVYEEDIAFLKYDVQVKDIYIKDLKNQLEKDLKEKDDLKLKLEKFETSSKNLTKLIDSQISTIDKTGLGYDGHVNKSEVLNNVVDNCESDGDNNQVNDKFKKSEGYHAVSSLYTGNYMPPRADLSFARLDSAIFKSKVNETINSVPKIETNASKTSKDSLEKPKIVRSSAPSIEDWESDSEDENVFDLKK